MVGNKKHLRNENTWKNKWKKKILEKESYEISH